MQQRASEAGLALDPAQIPQVDDDFCRGECRDSFAEFYPKPLEEKRTRYHREIGTTPHGHETVDESVFRRLAADPDYRPPNLMAYQRRAAASPSPAGGSARTRGEEP
jgi:hypothetical protein